MKVVEHEGCAVNIELCRSFQKVNDYEIIYDFTSHKFSSKTERDRAYDSVVKFIRDNVKGVLYV